MRRLKASRGQKWLGFLLASRFEVCKMSTIDSLGGMNSSMLLMTALWLICERFVASARMSISTQTHSSLSHTTPFTNGDNLNVIVTILPGVAAAITLFVSATANCGNECLPSINSHLDGARTVSPRVDSKKYHNSPPAFGRQGRESRTSTEKVPML